MYINCDLRYFNLKSVGKVDIVMADPPWRISGAQKHGAHSNMFSNSMYKLQFVIGLTCSIDNFKLNYNTLSFEEIIDMDVETLSDCGFMFLWVLNSTLQQGLQCLNKWGYTYIDRVSVDWLNEC